MNKSYRAFPLQKPGGCTYMTRILEKFCLYKPPTRERPRTSHCISFHLSCDFSSFLKHNFMSELLSSKPSNGKLQCKQKIQKFYSAKQRKWKSDLVPSFLCQHPCACPGVSPQLSECVFLHLLLHAFPSKVLTKWDGAAGAIRHLLYSRNSIGHF